MTKINTNMNSRAKYGNKTAIAQYRQFQKSRAKEMAKVTSEGYEDFSNRYLKGMNRQRKSITWDELKDYKKKYSAAGMRKAAQIQYINVKKVYGISEQEGYYVKPSEQLRIRVENPKQLAGVVNEGLGNISDRRNANNYKTRAPEFVSSLASQISGTSFTELESGVTYKAREGKFRIDEDWNGNYETLPEHITFIELNPTTRATKEYLDKVMGLPTFSKEHEKMYKETWHEVAANTFIANKTNEFFGKDPNTGKYRDRKWNDVISDTTFLTKVKYVLNQSHMWAIASKDLPYKENKNRGKHEENYMLLTGAFEKVYNAAGGSEATTYENEHMTEFINMIDNEEDIDTILSTVDSWLAEAYT